MKKVLFVCLVLLFISLGLNVYANDDNNSSVNDDNNSSVNDDNNSSTNNEEHINKLYFTEDENRLYYKSGLIDEDFFLKHLEMVPGEEGYSDELIIENGTDTDYTLFFKVVPRQQSTLQNSLIENIIMKITLDDKVIYNGKATGLDYTGEGINLQNAIELGKFVPNRKSKMVVDTKLSKNYDSNNSDVNEESYIDWAFYARYGEESEPILIIKNPKTLRDNFSIILLAITIILLFSMSVGVYLKNKSVNNASRG